VVRAVDSQDFDKAVRVLPFYCVGLMQSVSAEDQQVLRALAALKTRDGETAIKALLLGIELH
jgi:hypothetical protein